MDLEDAAAEPVDFFVSYSAGDRAWAEWIAWELESAGHQTVLQAWDFPAGADFVAEMHRSFARASRLMAVLSPAYVASSLAMSEWNAVFAADPDGFDRRLVPVRVADFEPSGLHAARTYIDLVGASEDQARCRLLEGLGGGRAKPEESPLYPGSSQATPAFPGLPTLWNVPHHRNPHFVGRAELLHALESFHDQAPGLSTVAVIGMGGVGKTQLVLEYAYRQQQKFDVVWWTRAEEALSLKADLAALASALGHGEDKPDLESRAAIARRWLERHDRWLLVLDNADDLKAVEPILPQGGGGTVLITSRGGDWGSLAHVLDVDVLSAEEATQFLRRRTKRDEPLAAGELADELGCLPLALEQAAAVVVQSPALSLGAYLRLHQERFPELCHRGGPHDYAKTVATTWDVAFEGAAMASAAAADLLRLMAFLHPDDIPLSLVNRSEAVPEFLAAAVADPVVLADAVGALARYSLVRRAGDDEGVAVHRLVQAVVRERLDDEERAMWATSALRLVARAFPLDYDDARTWEKASCLLRHAQTVASHIEALITPPGTTCLPEWAGSELVSLLTHASKFLVKSGHRMEAVALADATAQRAKRLLGPHAVNPPSKGGAGPGPPAGGPNQACDQARAPGPRRSPAPARA